MKTLSYLALIIAALCFILALLAHFFFDQRILIHWSNYIKGVFIFLLTAIVFALYHIIETKSK